MFRLHLPRDQERCDPQQTVQKAVANYFTYRADLARLAVRRTLQLGRSSMVIGMLFLAACTIARAVLQGFGEDGWLRVVEEGLLIIGWVAMWRPVELLLYDWRPELRQKRTYENLARMRVEVVFTDAQPV